MIDDHASIGMSSGSPFAITPTLLITMSTRPKVDSAVSASAATSSSLDTSQRALVARPPDASISAATAAARCSSRSLTTTALPRRASERAVARPMPLPAPVMTLTAPSTDCTGQL